MGTKSGRRRVFDYCATVWMVVAPVDRVLAAPGVGDHRAAIHCAEINAGRVLGPVLMLDGGLTSPVVAIEDRNGVPIREAPIPFADEDVRQITVGLAPHSPCVARDLREFGELGRST